MSFSEYMRANAGECLLVVLSAWAVAAVGANAFYLDSLMDAVGYAGRSGIVLAVTAVLVLALYAATFQRKRLAAGTVAYVALLAVLVAAALALSAGDNPYADSEGNYFYLAVVMAFSATGCFVLTRTLAGSAVWFVAATFACSLVQAFYQSGEVAMSALAALSALALIVHRNFRLGLEGAQVAQHPSHARNFAASVAPVAAAGLLACGIWFGIIAPLSPGVAKITLITDYRQLPIQQLKGTAEQKPVLNYDMTTQNLVDGFPYTTDDLVEDPTSSTVIDAYSMLSQQMQQKITDLGAGTGEQSGGATKESLDKDSTQQQYDAISWSVTFPMIIIGLIIAALVALAIAAYFVGRRRRRTRRLKSMLSLPPRAQVEQLYRYLLGRLGRLGFAVPAGATLAEFADSSARRMDMITEETRVPFSQLTQTYDECVYGKCEPTEDQVVPFVAYYLSFWKAARTYLGNFKYFFKSFRL